MKHKKIVIPIVILLAVFLVVYYLIFSYKIVLKNSTLLTYPTISITQDTVNKINSGELLEGSTYFNDMWKIPDRNDEDYGNLVELLYRFEIKRYLKVNDYVIGKTVDFEGLGDDNIFFALSAGGIEQNSEPIFASNGSDLTAYTYVSLWGCTYGKSEEEIAELGKKIKIAFLVQHPNGKIDKKIISPSKYDILIEEASENDVYSNRSFLGMDN